MNIVVVAPNNNTDIDNNQVKVQLQELDSLGGASVINIDLTNSADYVPFTEREKLFGVACSKLRYGGEIVVKGTDILCLSHAVHENRVTISAANTITFGSRLSQDTIQNVMDYFTGNGFKIISASLEGYEYVVIAKRPHRHE